MLKKFQPENFTVTNESRKLFHEFNSADCYALWAAYSAGRPLLLRGLPGTGKSQAAMAIAEQLGWAFVKETINGSTELSDLHFFFDAIARLGEAQVLGAGGDAETKAKERLNPLDFLSPGAFWWAYHWPSAAAQFARCNTKMRDEPYAPKGWEPKRGGVVLLLDEIDKAQPDLANGLLETLGDRRFTVPYLSSKEQGDADSSALTNPIEAGEERPVLVVITTNEERELPPAFLRRCFVHTLQMESSTSLDEEFELAGLKVVELDTADVNGAYKQQRYIWLIKRGLLHFGEKIHPHAYLLAAKMLWADREKSLTYKPGLAEYIDLLKALSDVDKNEQCEMLDNIAGYALQKELQ